jgi:hypothetical protein
MIKVFCRGEQINENEPENLMRQSDILPKNVISFFYVYECMGKT